MLPCDCSGNISKSTSAENYVLQAEVCFASIKNVVVLWNPRALIKENPIFRGGSKNILSSLYLWTCILCERERISLWCLCESNRQTVTMLQKIPKEIVEEQRELGIAQKSPAR